MSLQRILFAFVFVLNTTCAQALPLEGLRTLSGEAVSSDIENKEKELVVFWASWCSSCRSELKSLPRFNERPEVKVITVNVDKERSRAQAFVAKNHIELPVLRDESRNLRKALQVFAVPSWFVYKRTPAKTYKLVASGLAFDEDEVNKALSR
jgi:thiol-disulfide isomerase/thioredoxin